MANSTSTWHAEVQVALYDTNEVDKKAKLTSIIRKIMNEAENEDDGERRKLSADDKQILQTAAESVLESQLLNFLKQNCVIEFAINLVRAFISDLDTLAQTIIDSGRLSDLKLQSNVIQMLKTKLETRGLLFGYEAAPGQWFDDLCDKCPTLTILQNQRWSNIQDVIKGRSTSAANIERTIIDLWSRDRPIRVVLARYNIPPAFADILEERGITDPDQISQTEADNLANNTTNQKIKAQIQRLYNEESKQGKVTKEEREKRRQDQKQRVDEANNIVKGLSDELSASTNLERNIIQQRLQDINKKLNIEQWQLKPNDMDDMNKLGDQLKHIEDELSRISCELGSHSGSYKTDEELISSASAGLALCGIFLGIDALTFGKDAKTPVLDQPERCQIKSPFHPEIKQEKVEFSSVESGSNFRAIMRSAGNSLATGLKVSGWGFSASGEHRNASEINKTAVEIDSQQINNASTMLYQIFCLGAFRIPKSQMRLNIEAQTDAKAITDTNKAQQFLRTYGSHISAGTHHLGGIMWRIIEICSIGQHSFRQLKRICSGQISNNGSLGYSDYYFSGGISISESNFNVVGSNSENTSTSIEAKICMKVEVCGPPTTNPELFKRVLQISNKTWHIVDRDGFESLVPVWEIMDNNPIEEIKEAAKFVRLAWIKQAHHFYYIPAIHQQLQRERVNTFSIPFGDNFTNNAENDSLDDHFERQTKGEAYEQANQSIKFAMKSNLNLISLVEFRKLLINLFQKIFNLGYPSHTNMFVEMMKREELPKFLKSLANNSDQEKAFIAQQFLTKVVFTDETKELLEHANVVLDNDVIKMLNQKSSPYSNNNDPTADVWNVPSVSLQQLPIYLTELKSKLMDGLETADIQKLNTRIADVLVENLSQYGQNSRIESVLQKFGWREFNFAAPLNEEHIEAFIEALKMCLSNKTEINVEQPDLILSNVSPYDNMKQNFSDNNLKSYAALLIDRSMIKYPTDTTANKWLIDSLRHRLELKPQSESQTTVSNNSDKYFDLDDNNVIRNKKNSLSKSLYDILIDVLRSFDATGKIEIFQLLLERHAAVPLLLSKSNIQFSYHAPLLEFVQIFNGRDRLRLNETSDLFRIAVISNQAQSLTQTKFWLEYLFKIYTLYKLDGHVSNEKTIAEFGIGYVNKDPCMVLHVIGDWKPLQPFIKSFANWILVEGKGTQSKSPSEAAKIVVWDCEAKESNGKIIPQALPYEHYLIKGPAEIVSEKLKGGIEKAQEEYKNTPGKNFTLNKIKILDLIEAEAANPIAVDDTLHDTPFPTLRSTLFILQGSFIKQAESELQLFSLKALNNPAQRATLEQNIENQVKFRMESKSILQIENLKLIRLLRGILCQVDPVTRILACRRFEEALNRNCALHFERQENEENSAWARYDEAQRRLHLSFHNEQKHTVSKTELERYKIQWDKARIAKNNSVVTLQHCWRELSHLYTSNQKRYQELPLLAVKHLLDGFNLELMDGDAAIINIQWIEVILKQLEKELSVKQEDDTYRKPRIFVLSVLGAQSTGKSTFLNLMFGVRFTTSVGMCTRGVNMQLIKVEERAEYDYILILDTEGLRAPEYAGLQDSYLRDNRMATLALLPADATIILNKGETNEAVREILPVVFKAYFDSKLGEKNSGLWSTRIFFIFNQIATNESHLLQGIEKNLISKLKDEFEKAAAEWHAAQQEPNNTTDSLNTYQSYINSVFGDFRFDLDNHMNSDIRVLGFLKNSTPPCDLPNTIYGKNIVDLREYIHQRIISSHFWKPRSLSEIADYIKLVWQCVISSNFQLNFCNEIQRIAYVELEQKMSEIVRKLNFEYEQYFTIYEKEINLLDLNVPIKIEEKLSEYVTKLENNVSLKRKNLSAEVTALLKDPRWNQWQPAKLSSWNTIVDEQKRNWQLLLSEKLSGVLQYDRYIDQYKNEMCEYAKELFAGDSKQAEEQRGWTIELKKEVFEKHFKKQLQEASQKHPASATKVEQYINKVYGECSQVQATFRVDDKQNKFKKMWDATIKTTASIPNTIKEMFTELFSGTTQKQSDEQFLQNLLTKIIRSLQGCKYYSERLVRDAIETTEKELAREKRNSMKEAAHRMVSALLISRLTEIQQIWDKENSVSIRFEQQHDYLWTYFQDVGNNIQSFALLSKTLKSVFVQHIPEAFVNSLAVYVYQTLRGKNWLINANVLLAYADLEIIKDLHKNRIDDALDKCRTTEDVCKNVLDTLISEEIKSAVNDHWKFFRQTIINSLNLSALKAQSVTINKTGKYFDTLKSHLLKLNTDILSKNIPSNPQHYSNCDRDSSGFETVNTKIEKEIPRDRHFDPRSVPICVDLILTRLRTHTSDQSVKGRCGLQCPLCRSTCTLEFGHSDEKHDAYHQPGGLNLVHDYREHTLDAETCATSVRKGHRFRHEKQWYCYQDFSKVFPEWKLPSNQMTLKLREYIFYKYHARIAERYNETTSRDNDSTTPKLYPCSNVPPDFNHNLSDLENELKTKIGISW